MKEELPDVLALANVGKTYSMEDVDVPVLRNVSLRIKSGEFISVVGPSGSGKSTLLHIMGLLDLPSSGNVCVDGINTKNLSEKQIAALRGKKIGFVFQFFNLHPVLTALENIMLPGLIIDEENEARAKELLELVGLEKRAHHLPAQLSGGERQRVAIARALMNNPSLLLADEPTGNLDSKTGSQIMDILCNLNKKTGITIIIVTHDTGLAGCAERMIEVKDGKIIKDRVVK